MDAGYFYVKALYYNFTPGEMHTFFSLSVMRFSHDAGCPRLAALVQLIYLPSSLYAIRL